MYYFLAITLDGNVKDGTFWPAYVLCRTWTTSEKRSEWQIIHYEDGIPTRSLPKVIVTEIIGHEEMIQFMSSYQKVDSKTRKHFHPHGALCWYECNRYGDPTGVVHFIKRVPEWRMIYNFSERGWQQLKKTRARRPELNELLNLDVRMERMKFTDTKMQLHQNSHEKDLREFRGLRDAGKEDENR